MSKLREIWLARDARWLWIPLFVASLLVGGYVQVTVLAPEFAWRRCQEAYQHASSAADSVRIDHLQPVTRAYAPPFLCGELRRAPRQ